MDFQNWLHFYQKERCSNINVVKTVCRFPQSVCWVKTQCFSWSFCFLTTLRLVSATWILDLYIQHPLDIFVWISIRNLKLDTGKFHPWFHFLHIILLSFSLYHLNAYPVAEAKNLEVIFIPFFLSVLYDIPLSSPVRSNYKVYSVSTHFISCFHPSTQVKTT